MAPLLHYSLHVFCSGSAVVSGTWHNNFLDELEYPNVYSNQFTQSFEPDHRMIELYNRLEQYYKDTPASVSNKDALPIWKEFKKWCSECGYTIDEINQAKMNVNI